MFCPKCGKELPPGAGFCPNCGTATGESTPQRTPTSSKSSIGRSMEDVIGKNSAYYLTEFQKIEEKQKSRFNWAALLLGPAMCFYRKCGGLFPKYFLIPLVLFMGGYLFTAIGTGIFHPTLMLVGSGLSVVSGIWLLVAYVCFGLKFNRKYYAVCKQKLSSSVGEQSLGVTLKSLILFVVVWVAAVAVCMGIATVVVNMFWDSALSDVDSDSSGLSDGSAPYSGQYMIPDSSSNITNETPFIGSDNEMEEIPDTPASSELPTQTEGEFDSIVGAWQDMNGYGAYLYVGYIDSTKQEAKAYFVDTNGNWEFEADLSSWEPTTATASGNAWGYGSEPLYAIDITRNGINLYANIYVLEDGSEMGFTFVPADPATTPYENPYYIG